jgi:hypothetical protein
MMKRTYLKRHVAVTLFREQILLALTPTKKRDRRLKRVRKKLADALRDMDSRARKEITVIFTELEALTFRHHVIGQIHSYSQTPELILLKGLRNEIVLAKWREIDPKAEQRQLEMLQDFSCIRSYEQSVHGVYFKRLRDFSTEEMLNELRRRGGVTKNLSSEEMLDELNRRGIALRDNPIEAAGDRILSFCIQLSDGDEKIKKWALETKKFGFENLTRDYWDKEIIPKIASVSTQQKVVQMVAELQSKLDDHNQREWRKE